MKTLKTYFIWKNEAVETIIKSFVPYEAKMNIFYF